MHIIKKLVSDTAIYGLSSIVGRVLNYLLVPLYTSILLPAEYGMLTELYAYAAFGNTLYTFGLETAYFRFASQEKNNTSFNVATSALLLISLGFSGFLIAFSKPLISWMGYVGCERYLYYLAAILAIDTLLVIPFAQLRLQKRALFFAVAKLFQIGLSIVLNILFLYVLKDVSLFGSQTKMTPISSVEYILLANLLANAAVLPLFSQTFAKFKFQLPWQTIKHMLVYAFPLLLMGLAGTANEMLSRVFLKYLLPSGFYPGYSNTAILGIFGACYKLSVFMSLAIQALRYAAEPFFFSHAQDKNAPQLYSQIMQGYILVACFILFAITANLDWLSYLFLRNPIYRTGIEIVPYLLLAYLWLGVYYNLSIWFKLVNKTYYGAIITGMGAIITVAANILLVSYLGYWGSVWATVASYTSMSVLCYYQGQKYYPIPYQVGRGLGAIFMTAALVPLVRNISYTSWLSNILTNLGFTFVFGLLLFKLLLDNLAYYNKQR
jgi:O-antigen/teichoic acid export membrane protein